MQARKDLKSQLRPFPRQLRPDQQDDLHPHQGRRHDPPDAQPGEVQGRPRRHAGHEPRGVRRGDRPGREIRDHEEGRGRAEAARLPRQQAPRKGLLVSLNDRKGRRLTWPYIASFTASPRRKIVAELGDLIYRDPDRRRGRPPTPTCRATSGRSCVTAEKAGPDYVRNAEALRSVQPEDVLPGDIDANLGAPWIPASDIQAFAAELFNVPPESFKIGHLKKDAVWSVEPDYRAIQSVAATADYGTGRINGTELLNPWRST